MHDCGPRNLIEVAESGVLAADLTGMGFPWNCAARWNLVMEKVRFTFFKRIFVIKDT